MKVKEQHKMIVQVTIVQGIADGKSSKIIAEEIGLSSRTIEKHIEQIKLQYKALTSSNLVAIFLRKKLIK